MALTDAQDEGAGEGYFASISDMMVGILFIFLLLLTVFALNFKDAEQEQRVKIEELIKQRALTEAAERRTRIKEDENLRLRNLLVDAVAQLERDIQDRFLARSQLLTSMKQSLATKGVAVSVDVNSGILRLPEDLLFNTGESTIQKQNVPKLRTLAEVLAGILPCYIEGVAGQDCDKASAPILETVLVEGHTDRQAFSTTVQQQASPAQTGGFFSSPAPAPPPKIVRTADSSEVRNDRLSTERALNVFKELRLARPSLGELKNSSQQSLLGFSGYGPRRPLPEALGTSKEDYKKNRRIDLRFVLSSRTSNEFQRLREQIQQALGSGQ
ncbi:MAG: hypothetical protein J0G36_20760 [Afipia sp.]|nr:hypothetical protein [Afipia sp.]